MSTIKSNSRSHVMKHLPPSGGALAAQARTCCDNNLGSHSAASRTRPPHLDPTLPPPLHRLSSPVSVYIPPMRTMSPLAKRHPRVKIALPVPALSPCSQAPPLECSLGFRRSVFRRCRFDGETCVGVERRRIFAVALGMLLANHFHQSCRRTQRQIPRDEDL
jgi:hypothetical protein